MGIFLNKNNINTASYKYKNSIEKICYTMLLILLVVPALQIPKYYFSNIDWYLNYNLFIESIAQISLICLLIFISYSTFKNKHFIISKLKNNISLLFLILFIVWVFISSILSNDISLAFNGSDYRHEGFFMYIYYAVFFLTSLCINNDNKKINLSKVNSLCSTLISITVIYQYLNPLNNRCVSTNLTGVFFHFNHCGYYLAISIVATSLLIVIERTIRKKGMYSIMMIIQVSALIVNDTFGAYLAVLLTLLILIILLKINNNYNNSSCNNIFCNYQLLIIFTPLLIFIIVTVILNILGIGKFVDNFSSLFSDLGSLFNKFLGSKDSSYYKDKESTGTARLDLWKAAIKYSLNHPLLGSGLEQLTPYYKSLNFIQTKPANEYIYILVSSGFPALIFYLMWIGKIFLNKIKKIKVLSNTELIGILCSISYLISAFFGNSTFYITPYFLMFLAFI